MLKKLKNLRKDVRIIQTKLKNNNDIELKKQVDSFVLMVQEKYKFTGKFCVYTIYDKFNNFEHTNLIENYALIHTEHPMTYESFESHYEVFHKEAVILHNELVKSGIKLDYFFIMPYFSKINNEGELESFLGEITVIGKKVDENE